MSNTPWSLIPLTPEYIQDEHGGYVAAIESALASDKKIYNIALSGNYGVGKSSILREVAERLDGRVLELSLSTLAPIEVSKLDVSVPIQATTPTNRIQQEIVKQLLYREDPRKTPGSRFRRIERFRWWRGIGIAALLGLAAAVTFLLTGWTSKIASVFATLYDPGAWGHLIVWGLVALIALLMQWLLYGKLHIKQLSAGAATVTLDGNSVSYFDQYLDEIVYFFEVSDRDIVIFEDIDRFNDSYIFETLRALNTVLNVSPQIKKKVRFIYAIKDSIFDRLGLAAEGRKLEQDDLAINDPAQAEAEAERANRTKFFDLVIPVVPFITHRSARNLAMQQLREIEHEVAPELIDLAARYVPDMRLLKNVRNEFIVFRDRIFSGDGEQLNLSETDLFAMMLYKSTHLTDFEAIRLGKSKLDVLYKISRELVSENIQEHENKRRELRQQLSRINGAATRSAELGKRLVAHAERTAKTVGVKLGNGHFTFNGLEKSINDLEEESFWASFVSREVGSELIWHNRYSTSYGTPGSMSFSRESLVAVFGDPLDAESWNEANRKVLTEQIDETIENIRFLRSADLGDLTKRPEFCVEYSGKKQSFETIAKTILTPGLAYQLVRAGYINRNFTLYTSTFHGDRVGAAAMNFIIHHVERDLMDEHFELAAEDVDAVVRERGKNALKEPALYNIAILDHLLVSDFEAADIMIRSLAGLGETQARFLQAYLTGGEQRLLFTEQFTSISPRMLIYLVSLAKLDDVSRLELVDVALTHLGESKQKIDAAVSKYLSAHYDEFTALTSDATAQVQAERIGALFSDANITVPHLEPLGRLVRQSFVSRNLYKVTHENLAIAIDNRKTVALDVIRAADKTVYDYVLGHLSTYMDVVDASSATIDANEHFISVIEEVLKRAKSSLSSVVERATPGCRVADLTEVSEDAWPALAAHQRFPATFRNVSRYLGTLGSVDALLANVLTAAGKITETASADEESKTALALAVLRAKDQLPSAPLRVELVASLRQGDYLCVDDIAAEQGDLFALLLKQNVIADDAESYEPLSETDWSTRKAFIKASAKFKSYMTAGLVQPDLAEILSSNEVNAEIKRVIVEQAAEYVVGVDLRGLNELAQFATRHEHKLPPDVVQKMAQDGVATQQIVLLLKPHLTSIGCDQLFTILQSLGGDYPKLTEIGRDKPRVPNTPADRALLDRLLQNEIVSSYDEHESSIKVNKKYK